MKKKYTKRDGQIAVHFLNSVMAEKFILIGSNEAIGGSDKDIDILMVPTKYHRNDYDPSEIVDHLSKILKAKKVARTDWGGVYFHNTIFGDIDMFHSGKSGFMKELKPITKKNGNHDNGYSRAKVKNKFYKIAQQILKKRKIEFYE